MTDVAAEKAKTASRRFVEISESLASWLGPLAQEQGAVCTSSARVQNRLEAVRSDAGITDWPKNALRHSFASYHLAKHRDAGTLALELGHTTTNLIFRQYRLLMQRDTGKLRRGTVNRSAGSNDQQVKQKTACLVTCRKKLEFVQSPSVSPL